MQQEWRERGPRLVPGDVQLVGHGEKCELYGGSMGSILVRF